MGENLDPKEEHPSNNDSSRPIIAIDRTKRDEWSEGAVMSLLDAYEAKWVLRNRAKLKGQDWDDVARAVSARAGSVIASDSILPGKSAKTATQCKNKVESMKKRYRSESANGNVSRWPLFARLDNLVRCREPASATPIMVEPLDRVEQAMGQRPFEPAQASAVRAVPELPKANGETSAGLGECRESTSKDHITERTNINLTLQVHPSDESSSGEKQKFQKNKKRTKRKERSEGHVLMKSMQLFAEVALQIEQSRIDAMREIETMRVQAEARRLELDLKRTEIVANTQLKIAELFARKYEGGDSSSSGS
ncbi:hypothetical protein LUZ60_003686 [Juncus effusus]|nr:hypothetical protein LUZ60_003686 [Juncus effusus]